MQNEDLSVARSGLGAKTKDGGSAFPSHGVNVGVLRNDEWGEHVDQVRMSVGGLSIRDYFAAHAPAEYLGAVAAQVQASGDDKTSVSQIMATAAFLYADDMIKARE